MKNTIYTLLISLSFVVLLNSCSKNETIDKEYPIVDITVANAFPQQCSSVNRGEKLIFKARLSDNAELGSYSLDIHQNFDQHSHSTEVNNCTFDAVKAPIKPFVFINTYNIPPGLKTYDAMAEISIPYDIDPGDYHFMIKVTDKEGWQTLKGLSIKIK